MSLTLPDRLRAWLSPEFAARAAALRSLADAKARSDMDWVRDGVYGRNGGNDTRTDTGWSRQPFGPGQTRTLTPEARRQMVKRARAIYEGNVLGRALIDRCADNVIGEGMKPEPMTDDPGWNKVAKELWADYGSSIDASGRLHSHGEWQHAMFTAAERDGDLGGILLRSGRVQPIESDYVRSPYGDADVSMGGDDGEPDIVEGVELAATGRPRAFHVASYTTAYKYETTSVAARNFVWLYDNARLDRTAVRGVPRLAQIGWLLDQVDGTLEAVTIAYRMAAMFGVLVKQPNPGNAFGALPATATSHSGAAVREFALEPGMVEYLQADASVEQVKAEHPTSSFDAFMAFNIRMAGLEFGMPLELALLDFSKTNYSSARASMEQAYRVFRVRQHRFANSMLQPIYRWKVSRWVKDGLLTAKEDAWKARWMGQPWPYLDPQKDAISSLTAVDGGLSLLSDELMKRGYDFNEFIAKKADEARDIADAGLSFAKSTTTRDADAPVQQEENDDDEA